MKIQFNNIDKVKYLIKQSDRILIGAGAGLSTAAGIDYAGTRFKNNFSEYIKKYGMEDMYTAGFYPFKTEEEKWGFWSKHIYLNNINLSSNPVYEKIYQLVKDKDYFVLSTNVDDLFTKSGFPEDKIFATQGSYNYIQCQKACHNKIYNNTELISKMIESIDEDLKIDTDLIPHCPVCGELMDTNLRKDNYFVEDEHWHIQNDKYKDFINSSINKKTLLLEFGVGFNTPGIIRFPFEAMVSKVDQWNLVRFNTDQFQLSVDISDKYYPINQDIGEVLDKLLQK